VFIDADKPNYRNYYEAVLPKLADNGLIIADNALRDGRVLDDDADEPMKEFNHHVLHDWRVDCVLLTVRDGMLLVMKR
jgi:caffeoyl-CoA O-methyltransferase